MGYNKIIRLRWPVRFYVLDLQKEKSMNLTTTLSS
jgi:hypothetical protein